jgi:DNA-binding transcriptional MerR regulator
MSVDRDSTTVGRLARRFGLSRSTLLYYHRIGLLVPSEGGDGDYRRYTADDARRLAQVVRYREAGVPLAEIARILDGPGDALAEVLERRLDALNREIAGLREQQRVILGLLRRTASRTAVGVMNVERWTQLLAASGFSEEDMRRWHVVFERQDPDAHREFLEFLCLPADEVARIRGWAARG